MGESIKLQLKKIIKAKRQAVFDAWSKPDLMKQWYAPGAMKVPNATADFRVGGKYSVEMKGEMNGQPVNPTVNGTYKKIIPNELISFGWNWQGNPLPETLVTVEFKDVPGGTEVMLTHEHFGNAQARDKHIPGWEGCLENLAKFCEK